MSVSLVWLHGIGVGESLREIYNVTNSAPCSDTLSARNSLFADYSCQSHLIVGDSYDSCCAMQSKTGCILALQSNAVFF